MLKKLCCIDCFGKRSIDSDTVDHPSPHRVPIDKNTRENHSVARTTHTESSVSLAPDCKEPLTNASDEPRPDAGSEPGPEAEAEPACRSEALHETELVSGPKREEGKRNLWAIAQDQLDEKSKNLLQHESDDSIENVLDSLITETRERYTDYKKGGLEIRKREGGTFHFRDSAKKVIVFTLQTQELIKGAAGFDPTGHAAAAWSVVSFGLTLIKNDIDRRDAVMESSEFLAWALSYHAIIDSNYRSQNGKSNQGLENALVEVYVAILQYTAEVEKARKENVRARTGNSIIALVDKPLERLKSVVETKSQTLERWKNLCRDEAQKRDAEHILAGIDETIRTLATVELRSRSQEERDILDWISNIRYDDIQNRTQKNRSSDTGSWFLKSLVYIKWRATPGEILWLHGVVGCGKSVLCSTIIDDIESHCRQNPHKTHAYWYFQFSYQDTQRVENTIRSLIRQLCPNPLPESVRNIWEEGRKNREPNSGQLVQILHGIISQLPSDVFIIFDALDECPQKSGQKERKQLLDFIEQLLENHRDKLHLVVTSRPEPDIREKLEKYKCVNLESGLSDDVETFVDAELETGKLSKWDQDIRNRIKAGLVGVSERRFRWADLQIKRLEGCRREENIDKALASIPASLEEFYRNILEDLEEDDRDDARTILLWLSFSVVPLTLKAIADVVSLRFEDDIVKICTTALVTSSEDNTIRLAHFSVKEFLLSKDSVKNAGCFHLSAKLAHHTILEKSLSELLDQDKPLKRDDAERQPLLIYAAKYWHNHFEALEESTSTQYLVIQRQIEDLFMRPECYFNWIRLADSYNRGWHMVLEECETAIHQASKMGLMRTVQRLLESGADPMVCYREDTIFEEDAYSAAAKRGYLPILEYLLQRSITMPTRVVCTIMQYIDYRQHGTENLEVIIDLLWYMGALYDKSQDEGNRITSDIIWCVAMNPHSGSELLKIFLNREEKAIVPITEDVLNSVVSNRVCGGRMLEMLFQRHNEELHFSKIVMESMIFHASTSPSVVQVFVKYRGEGPGVESYSLAEFAGYASYEVMEALFQIYGNHMDVTEQLLVAAASNSYDGRTISLFLEARDRPTDISNEIFLTAASNSRKGAQIMESLLRECGPDVEMGEDMLIKVVSNSDNGFEILKLLLQKQQAGIVVSERVLVEAALHNRKETMQLLMDNRGPCIVIADELFCAAAANVWDCDAVMKYLFDLKPDHGISDNVLHSAAGNSTMTEATFSMLLDRFKSSTVPEAVFRAAYGNGKVMKLLLDRFHDRAPIPRIIELMINAGYYNEDVLQILLERKLLVIDEKLIEAVAGESGALELLSKHDPNFPVTEAIIAKATRKVESLRIVLNIRNNAILVTKKIMKTAIKSRFNRGVLSLLFTRLGSKVPITEKFLIYTAKNNHVLRSLPILLKQRRRLDLQTVWEAWWQRDWPKRVRASEILCENYNVEVSEHIVKKLCQDEKDYDLTELLEFSTEHRVPISSKGRTMEMIIERQDVGMVYTVLRRNPHIKITENLLNAAKRKSGSDQYFLMWLFHIKMKNDEGN